MAAPPQFISRRRRRGSEGVVSPLCGNEFYMLWRSCIGPPRQPKLSLSLPIKEPSFCRLTVAVQPRFARGNAPLSPPTAAEGVHFHGPQARFYGFPPPARAVCLFSHGRKPGCNGFLYIAPAGRHHTPRAKGASNLSPFRTFGPKGRQPSRPQGVSMKPRLLFP